MGWMDILNFIFSSFFFTLSIKFKIRSSFACRTDYSTNVFILWTMIMDHAVSSSP